MKKNQKEKENSVNRKQVMIISSDDRNWSESDFYPMQNWSPEDRQLWEKIMLEKKKTDKKSRTHGC
ncbi:hypothetical protein [Flavobacterium sp. MDT1-60]|uniref:hypothetical protein n=1 Tax=Flavobacterium sp. MDT1-60 TaxID=1979344 RepID=UPI00177CA361|nr:hypothetical protein [Flavobacterium sp. MDT1-60]QOG01201.1 hypothetical protein IHE43_15445 [Flavobacterium sp. MDT1-60]